MAETELVERVSSDIQARGVHARRVEPPCSAMEACGGCPLMAYSVPEQRRIKKAALEAALVTQGLQGLHPLVEPVVGGEVTLGYRGRVRLRIDERGAVQFFNPEKLSACVVLEPSVLSVVIALQSISVGEEGLLSSFAYLEVRGADRHAHCSVYLTPRHALTSDEGSFSRQRLAAALRQIGQNVLIGIGPPLDLVRLKAKGEGHPLHDKLTSSQQYSLRGGVYQDVPLGSFMQVNREVNDAVIGSLLDGAKRRGISTFVDLYCGSGNFILPMLAQGHRGIGVEYDEATIAGAVQAARAQRLDGQFVASSAEAFARQMADAAQSWDLVILDPPRAGVREGLAAMAQLAEEYVVLISCRADSMARDLRKLLSLEFSVQSITPFDMFPQTHHVETLVWLRRETRGGGVEPTDSGCLAVRKQTVL